MTEVSVKKQELIQAVALHNYASSSNENKGLFSLPEDGPLRVETCQSDKLFIKWCVNNIYLNLSVFI